MAENSTPVFSTPRRSRPVITSHFRHSLLHAPKGAAPSALAIQAIRQFARSYHVLPAMPSGLTSVMLN